ncbi:MAG: TonB C-terminal domain-containing protein [Candidatus Obscuribacterales bacterium]|nr:TonB C-terminal domain-containing protein [Candidatus Obscuribacterales bacterium]
MNVIDPDRSLDELLKPYVIGLRKRIERRWIPNVLSPARIVKVYFMILQDGSIPKTEVTLSSGDAAFDASAVKAIEESGPLPQVPVEVLNIEATFDNRYFDQEILQANIQRRQLRLARSSTVQPEQQFQQPAPYYSAPTNQFNQPPITYRQPAMYEGGAPKSSDWTPEQGSQYGADTQSNAEVPSGQTENTHENGYCPPADSSIQFDHPINSSQFRRLSSDQKLEYKQWLTSIWLKSPMPDGFRSKASLGKVTRKK